MELGMLVPQCVPSMFLSHPYSPGGFGRKGSWKKALSGFSGVCMRMRAWFETSCFCTQALNTPGEEENNPGTAAVLWLDVIKRKKMAQ